MNAIGALSAALCVACVVLAARRASGVERWISRLDARRAVVALTRVDGLPLARIIGGACGAVVGAGLAWIALGAVAIPVTAYLGALMPAVVADRRASARRAEADHALVTLVEWLCALAAAGRPVEASFMRVANRTTRSAVLNDALAQVRTDYTLGVPLHDALSRAGARSGLVTLAELGARLEQARELGRGATPLLSDLRDDLRAAERARALRAAAAVEGKLMLVVTLCYLPALALLVIVPLFVTLLAGLFAS